MTDLDIIGSLYRFIDFIFSPHDGEIKNLKDEWTFLLVSIKLSKVLLIVGFALLSFFLGLSSFFYKTQGTNLPFFAFLFVSSHLILLLILGRLLSLSHASSRASQIVKKLNLYTPSELFDMYISILNSVHKTFVSFTVSSLILLAFHRGFFTIGFLSPMLWIYSIKRYNFDKHTNSRTPIFTSMYYSIKAFKYSLLYYSLIYSLTKCSNTKHPVVYSPTTWSITFVVKENNASSRLSSSHVFLVLNLLTMTRSLSDVMETHIFNELMKRENSPGAKSYYLL